MSEWRGINEFMAVVDSGSFTAAAEQLGTTTSHISKRIAELENRLGIKLIYRTTRVVKPTDEGLDYYLRCKDALILLMESEASLRNKAETMKGKLKVIFSGAHQPRYHVAILADFRKKYPHIELELIFTERTPDLEEQDFDVAIVLGDIHEKECNAEKIATYPCCICAHPAYFRQHGYPGNPQELAKFNCIIGNSDEWQFINEEGNPFSVKVNGTWRTGNGEILLQAARFGMGLAQIPLFSAAPYIQTGKLESVLQRWLPAGQPIWLVLPNRRHVSSKIQLFRDFIKEKSALLALQDVNDEAEVNELFDKLEVRLETSKYSKL